MKKLALVALLVVEFALGGCGASNNTQNQTNTQATGNWEAQLSGGSDQSSLLNFVTTFNVTNNGPLNITGFAFFNSGACFGTGTNAETESGSANFTTSSANSVTGTLSLTVTSKATGSSLDLNGALTGTSNATTTTTGSLSNGVVVGTWSLTPGNSNCSGATKGTFIMCQGKATCNPTTSASAVPVGKSH